MSDHKFMSPRKAISHGKPPPEYASGGRVAVGVAPRHSTTNARVSVGTPERTSGIPDSPLEAVKRRNGIPGMKDGGETLKAAQRKC
jgi:hypothetical protein